MFKLNLRRQTDFLADADNATRRAKVSWYVKKIKCTDLLPYPLKEYEETSNPREWGPDGLRRSEFVHFHFVPASGSSPSSKRTSMDVSAVSAHYATPVQIPAFPKSWSRASRRERRKIKEIDFTDEKDDMVLMTIHHQNQNKITILFSASYWTFNTSMHTDTNLALELFAEQDAHKAGHWWTLAHAASKESSMRYGFSEKGIRIDHIRKNVRFSPIQPPVHVYEPAWIDDDHTDDEEDVADIDDTEDDYDPSINCARWQTLDLLLVTSEKMKHHSQSDSSISSASVDSPL